LNNEDQFYALTLDNANDFVCVGRTKSDSTIMDILMIKYENSVSKIPVINSEDSNIYMSCYPNPANETVFFKYLLTKTDVLSLTIFDILGNEVYYKELGQQVSGDNLIQINVSNFKSGIYNCVLNGKIESIQSKMTIIK
jgi:hypothetical protein